MQKKTLVVTLPTHCARGAGCVGSRLNQCRCNTRSVPGAQRGPSYIKYTRWRKFVHGLRAERKRGEEARKQHSKSHLSHTEPVLESSSLQALERGGISFLFSPQRALPLTSCRGPTTRREAPNAANDAAHSSRKEHSAVREERPQRSVREQRDLAL